MRAVLLAVLLIICSMVAAVAQTTPGLRFYFDYSEPYAAQPGTPPTGLEAYHYHLDVPQPDAPAAWTLKPLGTVDGNGNDIASRVTLSGIGGLLLWGTDDAGNPAPLASCPPNWKFESWGWDDAAHTIGHITWVYLGETDSDGNPIQETHYDSWWIVVDSAKIGETNSLTWTFSTPPGSGVAFGPGPGVGSSLSGTVWDDVNANGVIDSGDWNDLNANKTLDAGEPTTPGLKKIGVVLYDAYWNYVATTVTDDNGAYHFDGIEAAEYIVYVSDDGNYTRPVLDASGNPVYELDQNGDLVPVYETLPVPGAVKLPDYAKTPTYDYDGLDSLGYATVSVPLCSAVTDVNFGYNYTGLGQTATPGSLSGTVWFDADGSGGPGPGADEYGLTGFTVTLTDANGNPVAGQPPIHTTSGGTYLFKNLKAGSYNVTVTPPDPAVSRRTYTSTFAYSPMPVSVAEGQDVTDVNFGYNDGPSSISGVAWEDLNGDKARDVPTVEPRIPSLTVALYEQGGTTPIATAITDANGAYAFTGLTPLPLPLGTTYVVKVMNPPAGQTETFDFDGGHDSTAVFTIVPGEAKAGIDFGYQPPLATLGSISGTTYTDTNRDMLLNTGDVKLAGVTVTLTGTDVSNNPVSQTTTTAADGSYRFSFLIAGDYSVSAPTSASGEALETSGSLSVTLAAGTKSTGNNFGYVAPSSPSVTLTKTGPARATVGDTITYHFKVTNNGNTTFSALSLTDALLGGGIVWQQAAVAPGTTFEFDKTYVVKPSDAGTTSSGGCSTWCTSGGSGGTTALVNKATAKGTTTGLGTVKATSSCTTQITAGKPGVTLVKTADKATAQVGDKITYHFTVKNTGNTTFSSLTVSDPLLGCGSVVYQAAAVAPGAVIEFDKTYFVKPSDAGSASSGGCNTWCTTGGGSGTTALVNTATATGYTPGLDCVTSTSSCTTQIAVPKPGVTLIKTADKATAKVGDTITYHFKITNSGGTTFSSLTLTDGLLGSGNVWQQSAVAPGAVIELDKTYIIKSTDLSASSGSSGSGGCNQWCTTGGSGSAPTTGTLVNTATATGYTTGFNTVTSTSSCSTQVTIGKPMGYTTYTQGGWGAKPSGNNPGALLASKFGSVYGCDGLCIGSYKTLSFTKACAIETFLPQGGTPGVLGATKTNPTSSAAGVFAGQVLALQLSVDFSKHGVTKSGLEQLHLASGPLKTWRIDEVLKLANQVLGGCSLPRGLSLSDLKGVVDAINNNYDNGTTDLGYIGY